ncbi:MAG: type II toxin-antitoxin system RelE/ParE family toxin [Planctomycetaceae bacterium]
MAAILRAARAQADLAGIWNHIAADNPGAADRLIGEIDQMLKRLLSNPDLGIRQDEIRRGLRCKPVRRTYLIFYESAGDDIIVLRILHGARRYEDPL